MLKAVDEERNLRNLLESKNWRNKENSVNMRLR